MKKGQAALAGIPSSALYIGVAVFTVAIVITLLATLQGTQTTGTAAYNATGAGIEGLGAFNDYWAVIVLIVVLAIVIAALYMVVPHAGGGY